MSYRNVDNWIIIAADDRDADVSWRHHRQRGSLGGVDCVALTPKPIHAPCDGVVNFIFNNGSGGHTATLRSSGGWVDQFLHLSSFVGVGGRTVHQGELIGYTGATVAPGYAPVAPHLHWHRIDPAGWYRDAWGSTNRRNPFSYFAGSGLAGGGTTPIEEEDMANVSDAQLALLLDAAAVIKDAGPYLKSRVGGSSSTPSLTDELRFIKARVGGAGDAASLTDFLRLLRDKSDAVSALVAGGATAAELAAAREELVAAIATVDEETLKTFGLQRI